MTVDTRMNILRLVQPFHPLLISSHVFPFMSNVLNHTCKQRRIGALAERQDQCPFSLWVNLSYILFCWEGVPFESARYTGLMRPSNRGRGGVNTGRGVSMRVKDGDVSNRNNSNGTSSDGDSFVNRISEMYMKWKVRPDVLLYGRHENKSKGALSAFWQVSTSASFPKSRRQQQGVWLPHLRAAWSVRVCRTSCLSWINDLGMLPFFERCYLPLARDSIDSQRLWLPMSLKAGYSWTREVCLRQSSNSHPITQQCSDFANAMLMVDHASLMYWTKSCRPLCQMLVHVRDEQIAHVGECFDAQCHNAINVYFIVN